jgi:putative DNA primase/helicase
VNITVFPDVFAKTAESRNLTWPDLCEIIRTEPTKPAKAACRLVKLAAFGDTRTANGSLRHDANILSVSGIEGDYDAEVVTPDEALALLEKHHTRAMVYTSPSHTPQAPRWRVMAPLSRPISPTARVRLVEALNGILGGILAGESPTLSQSYYFGPVNGAEYHVLHTFDDPEEGFCLDELDDIDALRQPLSTITKEDGEGRTQEDYLGELLEGDDVHANALRIVGRLVKDGVTDSVIRGLFSVLAGRVAEVRGTDRAEALVGSEIDRMIAGARGKGFADEATPSPMAFTPQAVDVDEDATHHDLAMHWTRQQGEPLPVGVEGALWVYRDNLWRRHPLERAETEIGASYQVRTCRRKSDYSAIARHAYDLTTDPTFFDCAPPGLMTPTGFYSVEEKEVRCSDPAPELRQRFRVNVTPTPRPADRWERYLDATFAHKSFDVAHKQRRLLQEIIGCALVGLLYKFEKAILFFGLQHSGKSTLLRIIEALVPREYLCAVSPFEWDREYSLATLAGKRINIVGELPKDKDIPAAAFKQVTGRDRVTGRNPYGRPFDFIPTAGHFFNTNHFPATRDQHAAFWRRWLCLGFFNVVDLEDRDADLDKHIISAELPAVAHWALEGASRVLAEGFTESPMHEELMQRWRIASDSVAQFLQDSDVVSIDKNKMALRGNVYRAFQDWCKDAGLCAVGKRKFFERVESLGYAIGPVNGTYFVKGVALR